MEATKQDRMFKLVMEAVKTNVYSNDPELKPYRKIKEELSVFQNKLVLRGARIIIPKEFWSNILKIAHEGHLGIVKTKQLIRDRVWFPGIDEKVENEIRQCIPCQLVSNGGFRSEPLKITDFP
jgi:hypothetical protein